MAIPAAYISVVLIWTTTPLAIQWSGVNDGYLFGVTARMVISVFIVLPLVAILRLPMKWDRQAWHTYLTAGISIYGAMLLVYWSAQFIPSGWISVIFGLTPVMTGMMAARWLGESSLAPVKVLGMLSGLCGLAVIFYTGDQFSDGAVMGVAGVVLAVFLHSLSTVFVKKIAYQAHGLVITAGGLLVSVPLFLLTWFLTESVWPAQLTERMLGAILYLGVIGSAIGFALFYYVLKNVSATRVALLTLITPLSALYLGNLLNNEEVGFSVLLGTVLILCGLALFEWSEYRQRARRRLDTLLETPIQGR